MNKSWHADPFPIYYNYLAILSHVKAFSHKPGRAMIEARFWPVTASDAGFA
jgi:hypothetical protein